VYLKRLDLHGFKTFADRTELEFTPGITAIVGPNGSGKSNVFDAIRWALGETSFRSLRSGRMDDIIFGGTDARRAMGQAEVSLTINNDSGALPIDYTEVTATRRAARGGEGECLLNDTVCRLRDIQMLFLGTGLGGRSYSLISQGQVDSVLNAGPEERRQLLEEAAGLARYKRRRREADRRLGHATTNLLRVSDLLAELTTQLEQLRTQAEAAAAHQAYTKEIRDLELALQVDDARRVIAGLRRISTQTDTVREQLGSTAAAASEVGTQMDRDRARAAEVAHLWEEAQRALLQVVEDLAGRESTLQVLHERVRATTTQRTRLAQDLQRFQTRLAQVEEALGHLREQSETQAARRDDLLEQMRVGEEASTATLAAQRDAEERVVAARTELSDLVAARSRAEHDLARLDARLASLQEQLGGLDTKDGALSQSATELEAQVTELTAVLVDLRQRREAASARLTQLDAARAEVQMRLDALGGQLQQVTADRQGVASTLTLLEDLQRQLAGYEQGVREILLARQQDPGRFPGIRAPIAEMIRVTHTYRPAVEAALGRRLFALLAGTVDDVKEGLAYLRGSGGSSASFLPVELMRAAPTLALPTGGEVIGRASDLVELTNGTKPVVDALLADVTVVTTLDAAVALRRAGHPGRLVTLQGELLSPDGVVSVGGTPDGDGSLLGRSEQIQTLRDRLSAVDGRAADLESRRQAALDERESLNRLIAEADAAVTQVQAVLAEQQMTAGLVQADLEKIPLQRHELDATRGQLTGECAGLEAEAAGLYEDAATIDRTTTEHEHVLLGAQTALRSGQESAAAAAAQLTEVRVQLAELSGTLDALQARVDEHVASGGDLGARCDQLQGEITVLDGEMHLLTHSLEEAQRERKTLERLQDATRQRLTELQSERDALQHRMMDAEARWRESQESLRAIEEQAHRLEVRHAQAEAELQAAQRRISEEFGISWETVRERRLPASRDEALGRIEALRGLVAALGPVNLRALDEHQALVSRVEVLHSQADDLERAKAALVTLMQHLDQVLQVKFAETFAAVNEEFNRLFVRLFAGGRARLLLVDGEPGTEPGIDIEAQLPGKKMRSLSALSGGERVLVALSLIFAMLRVHPSPFCIFDEVEAALDDANTRKFTTLLRELAEQTQVLIVTHNKGTMEAADVLYGVTMEAPGVSKIISMRLTRAATRQPVSVA
jgi:chromosome segregation protein